MSQKIIQDRNNTYVTIQDCLFLCIVVLLSLCLYVGGLGFYSDDWSYLGYFSMSEDQSLYGLSRSAYSPSNAMRPVKILYQSVLYWLFGLNPLGYHLVNSAVLLSGIVLFYLVLSEIGKARVIALAVPAVYALLPHYSTDRFWYAAFQTNLSMTLYFLSLFADMRAVKTNGSRLWGYKLLSFLSLLGSTLAYEVFLPLFLLNLLLVWYYGRKRYGLITGKQLSRVKLAVLFGSNLLALILVLVFKALTTTRAEEVGFFKYHIIWFARLLKNALTASYGEYGFGLPYLMWKIFHLYPNWTVFAVGGGLGLIIFGYFYRIASQSKADLTDQLKMLMYIALGLVVFGIGSAIFLTNYSAIITPTGKGNRIAIASAVGVAFSLVGTLGLLSTLASSKQLRRLCFCVLIAIYCMSGFVINNTLASFWIAAYRKEQEVLADIKQQLPTLPTESTLILDGVCPYVGPAVVFEATWDLTGALIMLYRDYTLRADVVTPNFKIEEDGLYNIYGDHHPYGETLFIYNFGRKTTNRLTDVNAARLYFQTVNPDHGSGCPPGKEAYGVPVF